MDKPDYLSDAEWDEYQRRNGRGHQAAPIDKQRRLPSPGKPMDVGRIFVKEACLTDDGLLTLRHWRGGFWVWRTTHWVEAEDRVVKSLLYHFTEHATFLVKTEEGFKEVPWAPTRNKIGDLSEALAAICILPADRDQPTWLDDRTTGVIVSVENGLLDVASREMHPHTPLFFNQTAVPFAYDAKAPAPAKWDKFLDELWPAEGAAILVLGEWFGYVISGRTDLQKIFVMVGPTRGGKGVIGRILTVLIGPKNVAGPTLNSLGGEFGLAPLIGKPLGVISDARFAGKDATVVIERLLSISGEDTLTVNRKYREQWTGKLPTRLHIISNELPKLGDASTAIVGRIVLLMTTVSWLGREDHELEPALAGEMTGILNWALDGLARLTNNGGRFTHVPSADEAISAMRDLASPTGAFARERCLISANAKVSIDALYAAYCSWSDDNGHAKPSKQNFGRLLAAAFPSIRVTRPRKGESRTRYYEGIGLHPHECAQCHETDGREERCFIGDEEVWLHPECQRSYGAGSLQ